MIRKIRIALAVMLAIAAAGASAQVCNVTLSPGAAFEGNASQGDVMRQARAKLRKFKELRGSVRNVPSINLGGGRTELDLAIRGPELTALAEYTERLRDMSGDLGIVDADGTPMHADEARPLLQRLFAHSVHPNLTCRMRWQPHLLAIWDNRCTQHFAINDYAGQRREMFRTSVRGTAPVAA